MNIGQLKKLLAETNLPDNTPLMMAGSDHSYNSACAEVTTALHDPSAFWWGEDHGDENREDGEVRRTILLIT